jgi:putative hydrolase of the HAD superfamily
MTIRAITFDFWCTLFRNANGEGRRRIRAEALARATGADVDSASEALEAINDDFLAYHMTHHRTLTPRDGVHMAAERLGSTIHDGAADDMERVFAEAILHHSPVPIDGALEAVQAARALRPTGVISDSGISPGASLRQLLARHGFTDHLNALVFSDEVGVSKPQAPMFERAAAELGVQPGELLHIGDLEMTDIAGAHAAGAKAILFAGDNAKYVDVTQADYVFHDWPTFARELPHILEA